MQSGGRLQWVQRNRQRTVRAVKLGPLVQSLLERTYAPDALARVSHTAQLLAGVVDKEFRNYCRIASIEQQTLILHVNDPGMVYALRAHWSIPILEALDHLRGRAAIRRVVFQAGAEGWRIESKRAT